METPPRFGGKRILRMDLIWVPREYMVSPAGWAERPAFSLTPILPELERHSMPGQLRPMVLQPVSKVQVWEQTTTRWWRFPNREMGRRYKSIIMAVAAISRVLRSIQLMWPGS